LGRPRDEQRRAELRAGACEYLLRVGTGVGAAEVVLDQLLHPLMAQFETYRSEADLIVDDEDLWEGTSAAPASAAKQVGPLQPRVRTPRLWARDERWILPPPRICIEKTSRRPA
jgi:hypothetical protein